MAYNTCLIYIKPHTKINPSIGSKYNCDENWTDKRKGNVIKISHPLGEGKTFLKFFTSKMTKTYTYIVIKKHILSDI